MPPPSKCPLVVPSTDSESDSDSDSDSVVVASGPSEASKTKSSTKGGSSSWVWQYFQRQKVDGKMWHVCQASLVPKGTVICHAKITPDKRGSTKSMINHLRNKHGISNNNARQIGALVKFLEKKNDKSMQKLNRESLLCAVGRYVVRCHIAYRTIEDEDFINLLELCNPITKSLLPSADTLATFLSNTFINGQKALKLTFQKVNSKISLTCDGWTSPKNESILGITAHWIDDYELKSIILATKLIDGPHSGINLASHLDDVLDTFGIKQKVFCITADNASNNTTMAAKLHSLIGFDAANCMLGCMPHVINLAAKVGIKAFSESVSQGNGPRTLANILDDSPPQVDMSGLISRISKFATYLKQSSQKAAEFAGIVKALGENDIGMIGDVATRWNSTFKMLERAYKIREAIKIFCSRFNLTAKFDLSESEWQKVHQLCDFLEPLSQATKRMSQSKFPSMMLAAPVYIWLIHTLQEAQSMYDAQELIPAATLMIAKLREYFNAAVKKPVYVFSTMLDPRMKADVLTNSVLDILNMDKATVIQTFQDTAEGFVGSHYKETEPSPKKDDERRPSISSALFKKKKIKITCLREEVAAYLDSECEEEACVPLTYWKCNSKKFPTLARMAHTYLAASASSTPCERAFSVGRHIQDYSRNRLKATSLESTICLQSWLDSGIIKITDPANLMSST
ncbi:hypothetical protein MJO29_013997 [Puccinia striiformis f. sp. tritici]|nr:hypothetical protein MJO29_013997 [Puccinia striiformis f. sp. tritici]